MNGSDAQRAAYVARINKAFDYIESNLENAFTLDELASVANFSKFHFSRIFQSIAGESPFQFVQRLRIEKAATLLLTKKHESISSIAFGCGFTDIAIFSRNFKKHFTISASQYRQKHFEQSNSSQTDSNNHQAERKPRPYFCTDLQTLNWNTKMELNKSVEVKELPKMTVAYIRHIGPYKGNDKLFEGLWNKLFAWAGPRGLIGGKDFRSLVIYHDDPNVTIEDKLRMSVCITVPADTRVSGDVGKMELEAANYVIARFGLTANDFQLAWDWLYGQWLPSSGYQPDDKPCFEMYPEEPKDGNFIVDICVPVKPM
ncbi:MAG TPA: GyrI-like domain-containing protein [Bacteroidales bacterium]|nr:GyrI-like domain-containing protein [Bacteroidales bacterium]